MVYSSATNVKLNQEKPKEIIRSLVGRSPYQHELGPQAPQRRVESTANPHHPPQEPSQLFQIRYTQCKANIGKPSHEPSPLGPSMRGDGANDHDPQKHDGAGAAPSQKKVLVAQRDVESFDEDAEKRRLERKIAKGGMQGGVDVYVSSVAKGPHDQNFKGKYSGWRLLFISSDYCKK